MEIFNKLAANFENISSKSMGIFSVGKLFSAIIVGVICILAIKVIMKIVSGIIEKTPFDNTLNSFIKSSVKIVLYFISVLIVADSIGIPVTSLLAVFSVVGLAVSLAVQGSLTNLAGGVSILAAKPFVNGDFVEIGGVSGTVKEIGLIYTKLTTVDNKLIYVPNSEVSTTKIINYTAEEKRRLSITVTASYDSDIDKVKAALQKAVANTEYIIERDDVLIGVSEYRNSSIAYLVRAWVATENYWNGTFALTENIKHAFDENGIEMTYDHLNLHIMNKEKGV